LDIEEAWRRKYRIELDTPRFLLRPLILEDVDWLTHLFADPEVNRFLQNDASSLEHAKRTAEAVVSLDLKRCQFGNWAIQDKATGGVHGWCHDRACADARGRSHPRQLNRTIALDRLMATLTALFGLLAVALAAVGLYGVMAFTVAARTREIGIRMALGASHPRVLGQVMGESAALTLIESP
jgi:hypothetical protein